MASLHKTDPEAPLLPEVLDEVELGNLPLPASIRHIACNLTLSEVRSPAGIAIDVHPAGQFKSGIDFTVAIEKPSGITGIFSSVKTDFDECLPGGITVRPDALNRRMLTPSGKDRIIQALRFGTPLPNK